MNHRHEAEFAARVMAGIVGTDHTLAQEPAMASEDFAFMAQECPGVYIWLGNGEESASLHNPKYDFNDANLPLGMRYWVALVQALLRDGKLPA